MSSPDIASEPLAICDSFSDCLAVDPDKRITIWQAHLQRKISGNAAPKRKNLHAYLANNPECEIYTGQDKVKASLRPPSASTDGSGRASIPVPSDLFSVTFTPSTATPADDLEIDAELRQRLEEDEWAQIWHAALVTQNFPAEYLSRFYRDLHLGFMDVDPTFAD